ncbi:MAG TPA: CoA ester lyase [Gemmatimonadaceae bacterium]|nr:CoA ester lyase [Gemmatimonadaceae bacterium]
MDPVVAPARSWLFVPANRHERFAKAATSGADRVIIDLEDAVGPGDKVSARNSLAGAPIPSNIPVYVRVNSVTTPWFMDDVAAAATLAITGVLLPKADTAADVERVAARLPPTQHIVPIIETALGAWNVLEVARATRVERLVFGALDFQLDTGMLDDGDTFASVRSSITLASKIAGIAPPIDAVTLAIDDDTLLAHDSDRSRRFGFGGKLCIHPKQLPVTNAAFRPSDADVVWARGLLAERATRPGDAVFSYRGTMVDRPVIERAKRISAEAEK